MSDLPPPPDDETSLGALIQRASSLALGLIVLARAALARFGEAPAPRGAAALILRRFILPAEATVRRAIIVLAASLPPVSAAARGNPKGKSLPPPPQQPGTARAPVFCLSEPQPRCAPKVKAPEWVNEGPRISLLDWSAPPPARPLGTRPPETRPLDTRSKADDAARSARLLRRLAALEGAYGNLLRQAQRYLRRRAAAARSGLPQKPLLSLSRIPGNTRHLHTEFRFVLEDMNLAASEALGPAPDSS